MTTVNANTLTSLEEAASLIEKLCKLVEACYATIDEVDSVLFDDDIEEAERIIEEFYAATEELIQGYKKQVH